MLETTQVRFVRETFPPLPGSGSGKVAHKFFCFFFLSTCAQKEKGPPNEVNIAILSQQSADRFAVLMDLWTSEADFLEGKLKVRKPILSHCYVQYDIYI